LRRRIANFGKSALAALGVPKARVRILTGTTSRLKQVAIEGDPTRLGEALRAVVSAKQ
jgi:uncharacterized protein